MPNPAPAPRCANDNLSNKRAALDAASSAMTAAEQEMFEAIMAYSRVIERYCRAVKSTPPHIREDLSC